MSVKVKFFFSSAIFYVFFIIFFLGNFFSTSFYIMVANSCPIFLLIFFLYSKWIYSIIQPSRHKILRTNRIQKNINFIYSAQHRKYIIYLQIIRIWRLILMPWHETSKGNRGIYFCQRIVYESCSRHISWISYLPHTKSMLIEFSLSGFVRDRQRRI